MRMEAPWLWLLLPALLVWVWWLGRKGYAQLRPFARTTSIALRAALVTFLVAALSRPAFVHESSRQHVLFLLDASRSVNEENLNAAATEIDRLAREAVGAGHRVSLIAFGRDARTFVSGASEWNGFAEATREAIGHQTSLPKLIAERTQLLSNNAPQADRDALEARIAEVERFRTAVIGETTDLENVLRLARNSGDVGEGRTIYLFTDANFNRSQHAGELGNDWRSALVDTGADAALRIVPMDRPLPPEVAAADLSAPSSVRVNQGFTGDLRIASTVETSATLVVYKDGFATAEIKTTLKPGENLVQVPGLYFREKGFHQIEVAVRAEKDTQVENNIAKALVIVPGEVRVLYVDADEAQQSYLKSALELEGMQVEARPASGVPDSLNDLLGFDVFILANVPADRLSMRQMQNIRTHVQDFGGGFIMLGGENSFGLGGYFNTPVEEVLPVKMPIQKDMMRPSLGLMLVIDKSGSMEGAKIQLAKRAAIATAEAINPRDQIGVVGFDGESQVILELTPAGDSGTISSAIATLDAGGGTFLYPGLDDAHQRLVSSNARKKHIIILSDGQTQGSGYEEMAQMLAADGITVSAVGIGEGADMQLLEGIANNGGGRAYFTNDFQSIPQIFTREALRASKSMLVERLVTVIAAEEDESLEELDAEELPPLNGYVATTPRETAKTILISDAGDPILAKWRCGLGRTAAFTSDTKPRWAEEWIRWPDFAKFWTQLVRSVAGGEVGEDVAIDVRHVPEGDGVRVIADVRDAKGNFVSERALAMSVADPARGARPLEVRRDGPGLFSALVPEIAWGKSQQLALNLAGTAGGESLTVPFGYVYSFSPEFRTLGVNEPVLREMEESKLATVVRDPAAALAVGDGSSISMTELWPLLLILSILLAPIDIFVRRVG